MIDFLYKILPLVLPMTLSFLVYLRIDKKYEVTNKLSLKLRISQKWIPCFCLCCVFAIITVIGILGIYVIDVSTTLYSIICGIFTGIGIGIANKININKSV